jgi:hypothetical protein
MIPTDLTPSEWTSMLPWIDEGTAEQAGGWLWQTDEGHKFTYLSQGVVRIARCPPDWHYGKTRQELGNLNVNAPEIGQWLAILERREFFGPFDFIRKESHGCIRYRTLGYPIHDSLGRFRGYRGLAFRVAGHDGTAAEEPRAPRIKATLPAEIILTDLRAPVHCWTRDLSELGACLEVAGGQWLPDRFVLRVENDGAQMSNLCEVRWRRHSLVGVRFVLSFE